MIQNVTRVEKDFLIKTIITNEWPVRFHGVSTAGTGIITTMDRSVLAVTIRDTVNGQSFAVCEHLTGYFDCHGNTYAFETTVRDQKAENLRLDPPEVLLKSPQRKFVRVKKPKGIRISLSLPNEDIQLNYPVCPDYFGVEKTECSFEYDGKKLTEIIGIFRTKLTTMCSANTIVMFRTKKPESFEEKLITETGKVLFVPSTGSGLPKKDPYPEGRIITAGIEEEFEDPNYFVEGSRFEKMLAEKSAQGISSEIWCPIVYYQYVVGYIYAAHRGGESFAISMVDALWDFSRILAWELKETGYFATEEQKTEAGGHKPAVLDLSPGGMLVGLSKNDIRTPIKEGAVFATELEFGKTKIACSARVIRRYEERDSVSYGTTFYDLAPTDLIKLYEFLYKSPYGDANPLAYEKPAKS